MSSHRAAVAASLAVVVPLMAATVAADRVLRATVLERFPVEGMSAALGPLVLLRIDHAAPAWVASPLALLVIAAALAGACGALLPAMLRDFPLTGAVAAVATGLFGGGLVANWTSLVRDGEVVNVLAVPVPWARGELAVLAPADLAVIVGAALVALQLGATLAALTLGVGLEPVPARSARPRDGRRPRHPERRR